MEWLQVVGLCLDIVGVAVVGLPLIRMTEDEAIGIGFATLGADTREGNLRSPTVAALLRQRSAAGVGFGLLLLGFAAQGLGVVL